MVEFGFAMVHLALGGGFFLLVCVVLLSFHNDITASVDHGL